MKASFKSSHLQSWFMQTQFWFMQTQFWLQSRSRETKFGCQCRSDFGCNLRLGRPVLAVNLGLILVAGPTGFNCQSLSDFGCQSWSWQTTLNFFHLGFLQVGQIWNSGNSRSYLLFIKHELFTVKVFKLSSKPSYEYLQLSC